MNCRTFLPLLLLPLLITACAGDKKPPRMCPQVAYLRGLDRIEDYGNDTPDPSTLVAVSAMQKVEGKCEYEDNGVNVDFFLHMAAEKGPRLGGDHFTAPFFVSLVDPDEKVLSKELMSTTFQFGSEARSATRMESLHVFIPLQKDEDASNYRVLTGYQLTEQQLKTAREKGEDGGK